MFKIFRLGSDENNSFNPKTVTAKRNKLRLERKQTSDSDEGNHADQKDIIFKTPLLMRLPTGSSFPKSMKAIEITSKQTVTEGRIKQSS